jgi:predicted kinase
MDLLNEGVYDKGVLKAVFMAGGPGSGKSFAAKGLFGIPKEMPTTSMAYGLKVVNSDQEFEHYLRKFGFDTETGAGYGKGTLDLDKWPKEVWDMVGGDQSPEDAEKNPNLRAMTKKYTAMRKAGYMNSRLGMIIDGTARDVSKIAAEKKELEKMGYDCYMVFVNTTLPVAQARNKKRARRLPPKLLASSWKQVQANIGKFNGLFKGNFMVMDNSDTLDEKQATKKFNMLVKKGIGKFIKKPIKNPVGKQWIKNQKVLKNKGLKK